LKFGTIDGLRHFIAKTPIACENERMPKHPKRPRDPAQLAKLLIDIATGSANDKPDSGASPISSLARAAGMVGGPARALSLSRERRRDIAAAAAKARWNKHGGNNTDK
jgi:hypothetical protein